MADKRDGLEWHDDYAVGVLAIDEQHKHLLALLKRLDVLCQAHGVAALFHDARLSGLLQEFQEYAAYHFQTEESLMYTYLPEKGLTEASHVQAHLGYWQHIERLQAQHAAGVAGVDVMLNNFLKEWWLSHIQVTDRELGRQLNIQGVR
ncbi:putative Hemerythrin HHE cation binding region [Sterolibacterium denitrificans]|uniref:Hemerythrin HHE cation binding region n=1 Tax=Sterolibacterium denitrificans TaxID=157592 RepID=A0A7Z7HQS7_9PROT|nr:hemerythrin domain-containing protein [Sterolibacterium denitrificans]SMB25880.1 putative Hemerythrin HHE cation binding region [Sterolibacterium denitrificans]